MKILSIVGARPQFVKVATITRAIKVYQQGRKTILGQHVLIHTGQHYDYHMSQVFFDQLDIPNPDYHLEVGSGSHGQQTGIMLERIEEVLYKEHPDMVVVYGDTNSTLAGALAAVKLHIPVAHVESGLRSYNRAMPEEINRLVTDHVSNVLFCPTTIAMENLSREGITQGVHLVGDVMIDSLLYSIDIAKRKSTILRDLQLISGAYYLATVHRAENTDNTARLLSIFSALADVAEKTNLPVLCPLHPRTRKILMTLDTFTQNPNLRLLDPLPYFDSITLEAHATAILTDSGGIQEEAYCLQVPCITLRDETERVETVESGWNTLVGANYEQIVRQAIGAKPGWKWDHIYGDGRAAQHIIGILSVSI